MSGNKISKGKCAKCGAPIYEGDNFCDQCSEKITHCKKCGSLMSESAKFCINCGHSTSKKCACGAIMPEEASFCLECGAQLGSDSPAGSSAPVAAEAPVRHSAPASVSASAASRASSSSPGGSHKGCVVFAVLFAIVALFLVVTHAGYNEGAKSSYEVGSYVKFGSYPQNNGDTPEPIEWLVLDNDGKEALLISKYGLDCKQFHHKDTNISWRDCDLRKWLNGEFMDRAFNSEERARIAASVINTGDNPEHGTKGCGETRDKVFCLSIEEAWKYFGNVKENYGCTEKWHSDVADMDWWVNRDRACQPTAYAVANGAVQGKRVWEDEAKGKASEWWFDNCFFWLRSPGSNASRAARVNIGGAVSDRGIRVNLVSSAVRPALRIIL